MWVPPFAGTAFPARTIPSVLPSARTAGDLSTLESPMKHAWMASPCLAASLAAASCGTATPPAEGPSARGAAPHSARVTRAEHFRGRSSVLSVLQSRNAGMQVQRGSGCPQITLRGRNSVNGSSNPVVYVDGNRTSDTCILEMLDPDDVDRVEVYPGGVAPGGRPATSPTGLILVYMRQA